MVDRSGCGQAVRQSSDRIHGLPAGPAPRVDIAGPAESSKERGADEVEILALHGVEIDRRNSLVDECRVVAESGLSVQVANVARGKSADRTPAGIGGIAGVRSGRIEVGLGDPHAGCVAPGWMRLATVRDSVHVRG